MSPPAAPRSALRRALLPGLVALLLVVWIGWSQWDALRGWIGRPASGARTAPAATAGSDAARPAGGPSPEAAGAPRTPTEQERHWEALTGQLPSWPEDLVEPLDCDWVDGEYAELCARLESWPAVREAEFAGGVCVLIDELVRQLAGRPPEVASELSNHAVVVGNAFHLFRVLGRQKMALLRRLATDDALAEPLAMVLWRKFASQRRCRDPQYPLSVASMYDYATFLFQTLGGQAYLRRRTPRQEALASFYALLALDRALRANHNPQGVDPRPEARRARELLRGRGLLFEAHYVEQLDRIGAEWERRMPDSER